MKALVRAVILVVVTAFAISCAFAQEDAPRQIADRSAAAPVLPDFAPARQNAFIKAATPQLLPEPHKFFDRQQLLALYVHTGVRVGDTIKTCRELAHGGVEEWIPTQSCAGIAAWQAGSVGLALGIGYLFHRHGNHRLERITPWVGTSASAAGWTKSVFNIH